jgi:ribulose-phosphate 3-epimerase
MKKNIDISASVICMDWFCLMEQFQILADGGVNRLHIDVMDGKMACDFGLPLPLLRQIRRSFPFHFDYHVMCERPEALFENLLSLPGDSVCFHLTGSKSALRDLVRVSKLGFKTGFSVGSEVPLDQYEGLLRFVDFVTVVAVPPGAIGAVGDPQSVNRVAEIARIRAASGADFKIVADGNVTPQRATEFAAAGADVLVGGSTGLFKKSVALATSLRALKQAIQLGLAGLVTAAEPGLIDTRAA